MKKKLFLHLKFEIAKKYVIGKKEEEREIVLMRCKKN
jgi:hypothetical protein